MKQLQKNFTTPEQSKRLLELGVPENSADCYYYDWAWFPELGHYGDWINIVQFGDFNEENRTRKDKVYPCWSVGRLIEIYEICVGERFERKADKSTLQLIPIREDVLSQIEEHTKMIYRKIDFSKLED